MNKQRSSIEIPEDKKDSIERARRLTWWSLGFMFSIIIVMALVMGSSQAMKAMWIEDTLSLVPLIAILVGIHCRKWQPDDTFNYGYRRAVQIGFLTASVALFGFGVYLLGDSIFSLAEQFHPSIQSIELFGTRVWLGWAMMVVMAYAVIPPMVLGRMKRPLADELHDKTLYTSAVIDKGDWLSGVAGLVGILGIAYGYWWADSAAAAFISIEIIKDGVENLKNSVAQLMNMRPTDVSSKEPDPVFDQIHDELENLPWIDRAQIRLREDGDVLAGEAFIVLHDDDALVKRLGEAGERVKALDWRIQDFNIVPVSTLRDAGNDEARA